MPHIVVEISQGVDECVDIKALLESLRNAAADTRVIEFSDIKLRATAYQEWMMVGQGDSFIHITCRLLSGRTDQQKEILAIALRDATASLARNITSISVDIVDMNAVAYKKRLLAS